MEDKKETIVRKVKKSNKKGVTYECLEIVHNGYVKSNIFLQNAEGFVFNDLPLVDLTQNF